MVATCPVLLLSKLVTAVPGGANWSGPVPLGPNRTIGAGGAGNTGDLTGVGDWMIGVVLVDGVLAPLGVPMKMPGSGVFEGGVAGRSGRVAVSVTTTTVPVGTDSSVGVNTGGIVWAEVIVSGLAFC